MTIIAVAKIITELNDIDNIILIITSSISITVSPCCSGEYTVDLDLSILRDPLRTRILGGTCIESVSRSLSILEGELDEKSIDFGTG